MNDADVLFMFFLCFGITIIIYAIFGVGVNPIMAFGLSVVIKGLYDFTSYVNNFGSREVK